MCILPLIIIKYADGLCNSKNPDYESCLAEAEGFTDDWFSHNIRLWKKYLVKFDQQTKLKFPRNWNTRRKISNLASKKCTNTPYK